jgi:hypothetical protein
MALHVYSNVGIARGTWTTPLLGEKKIEIDHENPGFLSNFKILAMTPLSNLVPHWLYGLSGDFFYHPVA